MDEVSMNKNSTIVLFIIPEFEGAKPCKFRDASDLMFVT